MADTHSTNRNSRGPVGGRIKITGEEINPNLTEKILLYLSILLIVITFPFSMFLSISTLTEFQRAIVLRFGRLRKSGVQGPGIMFIVPCTDQILRVDIRTKSINVPPQKLLTRDHVTISVDAVTYYRISEPLKAIIQVNNLFAATNWMSQTTLRSVIGRKTMDELLAEKDEIAKDICSTLDEVTEQWGVKVERVEIKQTQLPIEIQRAMAAEQEAYRNAKSKVVAAQGELDSSATLKEASDVMSTNAIAIQLRYLQTLNTMSGKGSHSIIFPYPADVIHRIARNVQSKGGWKKIWHAMQNVVREEQTLAPSAPAPEIITINNASQTDPVNITD